MAQQSVMPSGRLLWQNPYTSPILGKRLNNFEILAAILFFNHKIREMFGSAHKLIFCMNGFPFIFLKLTEAYDTTHLILIYIFILYIMILP